MKRNIAFVLLFFVIPAKAGIHSDIKMDPPVKPEDDEKGSYGLQEANCCD
jgi:hypothetical protein